jgi:steroid delta-isomerase-like uncharacterized protein
LEDTMSTDPTSVVADWTDALNKHDIEAALAYVSDDCVFTNVGTGQHAEGRDAMRDEYAGLFASWSDMRIDITNLFAADGHCAKEWINDDARLAGRA